VKPKSGALGRDMLLTKKICGSERVWYIWDKNGRQAGGAREK